MLPFKLVYHEGYDLNLGPHVFPSQKFRLIAEKLGADGIASKEDFVRPEPAADEDILRVVRRGAPGSTSIFGYLRTVRRLPRLTRRIEWC